ncbi:MAG: 1-acyl-sn-glycerol-3-phosphate acyltransferase [Syntrophaceae bacterium]|nr:1-acyl-sn-glycerol-3-phosphate acyltransferase [Syntrophaceae bacterium]
MSRKGLHTPLDFTVTILLWVYYVLGWLCFYSFFYLKAYLLAADRERAFQALNQRFHSIFFVFLTRLCPQVTWRIDPRATLIRGAIIVANHSSFLDPIWLVSLFDRQKTIVKRAYFSVPIFGWLLKTSGYVPSFAQGLFTVDMADQLKGLRGYLAGGGNLFIFPEGTRSRDGRIGSFDPGAFKIARLCRAPLEVVAIARTERLFPSDRFLFNSSETIEISLTSAGRLSPDYDNPDFSLAGLMDEVRKRLEAGLGLKTMG